MVERSALVLIRDLPVYRFMSFCAGIERLGYRVTTDRRVIADVVIMWNRNDHQEIYARRHEMAGKPVIIAENGYIGNDEAGRHMFALSLNKHNGAGTTVDHLGASERWDRLGIEVKPWRTSGQDILVLPQRGIGSRDVAMPKTWPRTILDRLPKDHRHIRIRPHPGGAVESVPIEKDLAGVWATVTWASSAAIKAMVEGVPCFYDFPQWIGAGAAAPVRDFPLGVMMDDYERQEMLYRVSYAQWSIGEIESGYAFERLLSCIR